MKKKNKKVISWIIWAVAIIYLFLPTDLIPDVPVVGMIDDALGILIVKIINDKLK